MIWVMLVVTILLAGVCLWRFGKLSRTALESTFAALLIAFAGYAWQGNPSQPGSPVVAANAAPLPAIAGEAIAKIRSGGFGSDAEILSYADAYIRSGHSAVAVTAIKSGLAKNPQNADLWVGLGNALVVHGNGQMSIAAQFAFERAAALSPNHPGPPFFLGLGLAQAGKLDEAGEIWRGLLSRAPEGAPWRADLEARLSEIGQSPQTSAPGKPNDLAK